MQLLTKSMRTKSLMLAIGEGNEAGVRKALDRGASPNPLRWPWLGWCLGEVGKAPLVAAVDNGSVVIVEMLLRSGAKVDQVDNARYTALALAAQKGDMFIAKMLIEAGADVNHQIYDQVTPLCFAAYKARLQMVELLLAHGARPEPVLNGTVGSLLRIRGSILRLLVASGVPAPPEIAFLLESNQALGDF